MEMIDRLLPILTFAGVLGTIAGTYYGVRQKTIIDIYKLSNEAYLERNMQLEAINKSESLHVPKVHPKLHVKVKKANRMIGTCLVCLVVINCIIGIMFIYFTSQKATQLHQRTQEYVKCIAEVLVIPIADRRKGAIDTCTQRADIKTPEVKL